MNQLFCKENSIVFINNQEPLPDWCQLVYILNFTKKKEVTKLRDSHNVDTPSLSEPPGLRGSS